MSINWNNIRAIEGQREGFEELVCQLARQEIIDKHKRFIRVGKPDGGKECYWELSNGNIHCWQAKYFLNSLSDNQWTQVDKSVKTAIDNHPTLEKYYVAIPVDRPDGKAHGKSMLQKWNEHVDSWEKYALSKKMSVSFEYWGKHELEIRLQKSKNEGLVRYFFNELEFTDSWFNSKNQESIDALGARYTPKLNFSLPFLNFLDGFNRDEKFIDQINSCYEAVLDKHRKAYLSAKREELTTQVSFLNEAIDSLRENYDGLIFSGVDSIPFKTIRSHLKRISEATEAISDQYYKWRYEQEKAIETKGEKIHYHSRLYNNELEEIRELSSVITDFNEFLDSEICALVNNPYLILVGLAGIGKSHTLADIVEERTRNGKTSLLLLGENFSTDEMPWTQILRNLLRIDGDEYALLGALSAKAEAEQNRILLVIDALNEGNGRKVWPKKLKAFIRSIHNFPWLGLIVSVRRSFENLITPKDEIDVSIAYRLNHPGFRGVEYEASLHFFKHYNIIPPGSPLLHPEFQNPLFLKLFCEGLEKRGFKHVPSGYQGISTIIEYYLEGIEKRLSQPDQLDYDVRLKLLIKAVDSILVKMVDHSKDHLPYETGDEIVSNTFSGKCGSDDKQYLKRLISEGIINEDLYWDEGGHYDGIHFAYQRFQDHLIVSALLDKYLDATNPEKSFASTPLKNFLESDLDARYNQNIVEALSIQLPERTGKELHEVAPYAANYYATATAFIDGLIWRRLDTIGEASLDYVNQVLVKNEHLFSQFLDASISIATKPEFYFNADRLHNTLYKFSLAERDSIWTTWLQDKYGKDSDHNSVKRLIDWAWDDTSKDEVDDESARLAAVMLAWFLTSSNRYLRDSATKALVCLLQNRISVLLKVLQQFEGVNDPYVYERLYSVAYGCALRTSDQQALITLSNYIYKTIFDSEYVYPHILLRDYARGVIEYAIYLKLELAIEVEKIRPPYKSDFPDEFPTIQEIDEKFDPKDEEGNYGGKKWGATAILRSMTTEYGRGTSSYGDFGRYTFQSALSDWEVDYDGLSNYAVQRIFELGYDPEIFSDFDSKYESGRGNGHMERIGKKYQWIVFYEILAKVSDNCKQFDESSNAWNENKRYCSYDGPWNPYVRDIDPTITIKATPKSNHIQKASESPWWVPCQYPQNWKEEAKQWKKHSNDLPPIKELIIVKDSNSVEWLNLTMHLSWEDPRKIGEDSRKMNSKKIWYDIGSWLVKPKELQQILEVNCFDNVWKKWSPKESNRYEVFSREYHWAPASQFFQINAYHGGDGMSKTLKDSKSNKQVARAYNTAIYYLWEEEFDCSKDEAIAYYKPSSLISLGLKPSEKEGEYLNNQNEVVCFDPSVYEKGPTCLLVRKDYIQNLLKESKLKLIWVIQGEKQILGDYNDQMPKFQHNVGGLFYLDANEKIIGTMESKIRDWEW